MASSGSAPIRKLVLTGGGSRLAGLAERLQSADAGRRSRSATRWQHSQVGKTGLSPEQIAFVEPLAVVPVGLALGAA